MEYLLYWIVDVVVRPNVITWLVAIASLLLGSTSKYLWRWCVRQYINWQDRRERAAEVKEWGRSLLTRDLSLAYGHFVGKRRPTSPMGHKHVKSAGQGSMPVMACTSAKGNRGKNGAWKLRNCGPNDLLIAARKEWGLSQLNAAMRLNVEPQELGRWERGQYLPTRKMLRRLMQGYGKSAAELGYEELEQFFVGQYTSETPQREQVTESRNDARAHSRSESPTAKRSPTASAKQVQGDKKETIPKWGLTN
jgi:transcriptional regulator with XRE-family HTH domain